MNQIGLLLRSMLIWTAIIPLAILNGTLREKFLAPLLGKIALPLSGILLCGLIFLLTNTFLPRLQGGEPITYVVMGILWLLATVAFEFIMGFAMGKSLPEMLSAYNITSGNLWLVVILFTGFAPWLTAKLNKII